MDTESKHDERPDEVSIGELAIEQRNVAMPITYVNAKGRTYYLHQGTTKTGKPRYHFSPKSEGNLVENIPEGYEIYEHPNAQVFLRQIPPKLITESERQVVADGMKKHSGVSHYKIDVKGKAILIYSAGQGVAALNSIFQDFPMSTEEKSDLMTSFGRNAHYTPVMKFELIDENKRLFAAQRYCYRGSIEDWIHIGISGELPLLVRRYVKHIDKESFFDLI